MKKEKKLWIHSILHFIYIIKLLKNINQFKNIIKDLNEIKNNDNKIQKFSNILTVYNKMNNITLNNNKEKMEIYIYWLSKNGLRKGKGIMYFNDD